MADLTIEQLKASLDYDLATGVFVRRATSNPNPRAQAGKQAGSWATNGYLMIRVGRVRYLAHRLAWFYVHGRWPDGELDHANRNKGDNRIANLRQATHSQNMANARLQRNNSSGHKGVCFDKATHRWLAYVQVDGRFRNLGRFYSRKAAADAASVARHKAFGDFARV